MTTSTPSVMTTSTPSVMTTSTTVPSARKHVIIKTREFLTSKGAYVHPSLDFEEINGEMTMKAIQSIPANTVLMYVPKQYSCKGDKIAIVHDIALCLKGEKPGSEAVARIIECSSPNVDHIPVQYCTEENIKHMSQYDNEFAAIAKAIYDNEVKEYTACMARPEMNGSTVTREQYMRAATIYNSRAWGDFGLVPLMDLVQHKNGAKGLVCSTLKHNNSPVLNDILTAFVAQNPQLEINVQDPFLVTIDELKAGDEVFISYGDKTMVNMLVNYGFVDSTNAHVLLSIGGTRATEEAKKFIEQKKLPKQFTIGADGVIPPAFVYVNRIALDKDFNQSKAYQNVISLDLERLVVADLFNPLNKVKESYQKKIDMLSAFINDPEHSDPSEVTFPKIFYSQLLSIAVIELAIVTKAIEKLQQYWMSFVTVQV